MVARSVAPLPDTSVSSSLPICVSLYAMYIAPRDTTRVDIIVCIDFITHVYTKSHRCHGLQLGLRKEHSADLSVVDLDHLIPPDQVGCLTLAGRPLSFKL